jgi:hypothetical protein
MVNSLATLCGKIKEVLRPVMQYGCEFLKPATTPKAINHNLDIYAAIHPNRFHCLVSDLLSTSSYQYDLIKQQRVWPVYGHYESDLVTQAIAVALFSGPTSIGVVFRDFFKPIPLTTVAFILANVRTPLCNPTPY